MDGLDVKDVSMEESGYTSQWELMSDLFALLDYRLYLQYKYHNWIGPESSMKNMLGLVVTREEFEYNLTRSSQQGLLARADEQERGQIYSGEAAVGLRMGRTAGQFPLLRLFSRFGLEDFQRDCVTLAYAQELDKKYERLFAYLQDDVSKKRPGTTLAVQLYLPEDERIEEYMSAFSRDNAFTALFDSDELAADQLRLKASVAEFLSGGDVTLPVGMRLFDGEKDKPDGPLIIRGRELERIRAAYGSQEDVAILVSGPSGSGKKFLIEHLMADTGGRCLFADMESLGHSESAAVEAGMLARLLGADLCFYSMDATQADGSLEPPPQRLLDAIGRLDLSGRLFLLSRGAIRPRFGMVTADVELTAATALERLELFRAYLEGLRVDKDVSAEELASMFRFEPRQIRETVRQAAGQAAIENAPISSESLHRWAYRQAVHKLGSLASKVKPNYTWNDVVLPAATIRLMQQACAHIKYQHKVYYEWGFDRKISYGRGLSILFAGAPGTGKTMCAQVIAKQLNMEMYKINISQIVSKYIGETEKNLQAVFSEAKNSNCILFFDECDALFGKRSEVKDAHDRNANVEVAYLLQQIEEHDGVCILATNLVQNIDAAFMRRITYVAHFPFPDAATREEIYRRTIPPETPVDEDVDWAFIAEKFPLSGGHIKNIVLAAAFMAAGEGAPLSMRHALNAAVGELKKNEIVVVREELREYADLIYSD